MKGAMEDKMKYFLRDLTVVFSSGSLGALVNSITAWIFGTLGITAALGVKMAPDLTKSWLYPRIVWGGLWGFLFILPFLRRSYFFRGFLFSLGPTISQLFIVFPLQAKKGWMGIDLGMMTPVFVLLFNLIWGVCTAFWLKLIQEGTRIKYR